MISEKFQDMINKMTPALDRTIGIMNKDLNIIASSDKSKLGKVVSIPSFASISTADVFSCDGVTYKYFGDKKTAEYAIFVSGEDKVSLSYVNMLSVPLTRIVYYYTQRHSKSVFMKNLIFENLLPGEINFRIKELNISDRQSRVCLIVHSDNMSSNVNLVEVLREIFPDASKDFIIGIDEQNIAIVKEINNPGDETKLDKLASSIVSVLATKYYLKVAVGVGSIARSISDVINSFRCAQVALEVRKVFENEQSTALYSQLGIARLIYQLPTTLCEVFLDEVFKKCSIDEINSDLMFTINKFFENSLNISETARKLFIHRNTLVYRIEKIKRATGLDLRNFEDAIVFKVALMVSKFLKST